MKRLACLLLATSYLAMADVVFVPDPSGLNPNDSVDWGQFATNSIFDSPTAFASVNGLTGTAATADPGGFFRPIVPISWASGFFPGDKVLNTNSFNYFPITLTFNTPVFGVGAFVDNDLTIGGFTAAISVYNGDTLLATFSADGSNTGFGSAPFLGVIDNTAEITKVVFEITDTGSFPRLDMAISGVSLNDTAIPVPEPGALLLLGIGLAVAVRANKASRRL